MFPIDPLANGAPSRRDRSGVSPAGESGSSQRLQRKLVAFATAGTLAAFVAGSAALPAGAVVANTDVLVSATVVGTCLIVATPVAFGTYAGVVITGNGSLTVSCTNTTPYDVGLGNGLSEGATGTTRAMTNTGVLLHYVLTSDAAFAVNWGADAATGSQSGTSTGAAVPLTIYGQVAGGQFVAPGLYTDTISATVTF